MSDEQTRADREQATEHITGRDGDGQPQLPAWGVLVWQLAGHVPSAPLP